MFDHSHHVAIWKFTWLYVWNSAGTGTTRSNHLDLFGPSLMDDLVDSTTSTSTATPNVSTPAVPEVDLFADAAFQSANAPLEAATVSHTQVYTLLIAFFFYHDSFFISLNVCENYLLKYVTKKVEKYPP